VLYVCINYPSGNIEILELVNYYFDYIGLAFILISSFTVYYFIYVCFSSYIRDFFSNLTREQIVVAWMIPYFVIFFLQSAPSLIFIIEDYYSQSYNLNLYFDSYNSYNSYLVPRSSGLVVRFTLNSSPDGSDSSYNTVDTSSNNSHSSSSSSGSSSNNPVVPLNHPLLQYLDPDYIPRYVNPADPEDRNSNGNIFEYLNIFSAYSNSQIATTGCDIQNPPKKDGSLINSQTLKEVDILDDPIEEWDWPNENRIHSDLRLDNLDCPTPLQNLSAEATCTHPNNKITGTNLITGLDRITSIKYGLIFPTIEDTLINGRTVGPAGRTYFSLNTLPVIVGAPENPTKPVTSENPNVHVLIDAVITQHYPQSGFGLKLKFVGSYTIPKDIAYRRDIFPKGSPEYWEHITALQIYFINNFFIEGEEFGTKHSIIGFKKTVTWNTSEIYRLNPNHTYLCHCNLKIKAHDLFKFNNYTLVEHKILTLRKEEHDNPKHLIKWETRR